MIGGREIHPVNLRVGGVYRAPSRAELAALVPELEWARDAALELTVAGWRASTSPTSSRTTRSSPCASRASTRSSAAGSSRAPGSTSTSREYEQHFTESHVERSNALHSTLAGVGNYLVGPLARYALNHDELSPLAKTVAAEVGLGDVVRNPFRSIVVRAVETVYRERAKLRRAAPVLGEPLERPQGLTWTVVHGGAQHEGHDVGAGVVQAVRDGGRPVGWKLEQQAIGLPAKPGLGMSRVRHRREIRRPDVQRAEQGQHIALHVPGGILEPGHGGRRHRWADARPAAGARRPRTEASVARSSRSSSGSVAIGPSRATSPSIVAKSGWSTPIRRPESPRRRQATPQRFGGGARLGRRCAKQVERGGDATGLDQQSRAHARPAVRRSPAPGPAAAALGLAVERPVRRGVCLGGLTHHALEHGRVGARIGVFQCPPLEQLRDVLAKRGLRLRAHAFRAALGVVGELVQQAEQLVRDRLPARGRRRLHDLDHRLDGQDLCGGERELAALGVVGSRPRARGEAFRA